MDAEMEDHYNKNLLECSSSQIYISMHCQINNPDLSNKRDIKFSSKHLSHPMKFWFQVWIDMGFLFWKDNWWIHIQDES